MATKKEVDNIEEGGIKESFDHLDLSINLKERPDLIKKMTAEMRIERQKKQMIESYRRSCREKSKKIKETCKEEEFDYLDLTIDLRKRSDLARRMTKEMKEERKLKQKRQITKARYYRIKTAIKDQEEAKPEKTENSR